MVELAPDSLKAAAPLFKAPHTQFVMNALLAGNAHGRIWVDEPVSPSSAFLWDEHAITYFAGDAENQSFNQSIQKILAQQIAPGSFLIACYEQDGWVNQLSGIFGNQTLYPAQRRLYHLESLRVPDWRERIPKGFAIERIDRMLLSRTDLTHLDQVLDEIHQMWPSVDRFLQHGFGFCALKEDREIACWCTGEYADGDQIGIGIETIEAYQRNNLATLTASAFAEHCLKSNIQANWDCWVRNIASARVAEKVGFREVLEYGVRVCCEYAVG